jgi:hypothetical protein
MVLASQQVRGVAVCRTFVETARHILESFLVGGINSQDCMAFWNEASVDGSHRLIVRGYADIYLDRQRKTTKYFSQGNVCVARNLFKLSFLCKRAYHRRKVFSCFFCFGLVALFIARAMYVVLNVRVAACATVLQQCLEQ